MKYQETIDSLESIKTNKLDPHSDYEAVEIINETIEKLTALQVSE